MGQRAYRRDSSGRFAGSGAGTKVTYGRAGGWANASHQAKAQAARGAARNAKPSAGSRVKARVSAINARRKARVQARRDKFKAMSKSQKAAFFAKKYAIALAADTILRTAMQPQVALGLVGALAGGAAGMRASAMRPVYDATMRKQARNRAAAFSDISGITQAMAVPRTARKVAGAYRITSLR